MDDVGYLQHGKAGEPMRTEQVRTHHLYADNWEAFYEGRWRKVHIQLRRCYILYRGEKSQSRSKGFEAMGKRVQNRKMMPGQARWVFVAHGAAYSREDADKIKIRYESLGWKIRFLPLLAKD